MRDGGGEGFTGHASRITVRRRFRPSEERASTFLYGTSKLKTNTPMPREHHPDGYQKHDRRPIGKRDQAVEVLGRHIDVFGVTGSAGIPGSGIERRGPITAGEGLHEGVLAPSTANNENSHGEFG